MDEPTKDLLEMGSRDLDALSVKGLRKALERFGTPNRHKMNRRELMEMCRLVQREKAPL